MKSILLAFALLASVAAHSAGDHVGSHGAHGGSSESGEAIGRPGLAGAATRTVRIDMTDAMRFTPEAIQVARNETVRFVVTNSGKLKHELVLGSENDLKAHYALMLRMPEMEHADANSVTVAPGKSGEVVWQFTRAGTVNFACLQPGHYDAGMKGMVTVADTGLSDGEVTRVDRQGGRLTLRHGPIANLDMPGMTMVFRVKDAAMLDTLQPGDKVRFRAEKSGGALVVTELAPAL